MPHRWPALKVEMLFHHYYSTDPFKPRSPAVVQFEGELINAGLVRDTRNGLAVTPEGNEVVLRLKVAAASIADRVAKHRAAGKPYGEPAHVTARRHWPAPRVATDEETSHGRIQQHAAPGSVHIRVASSEPGPLVELPPRDDRRFLFPWPKGYAELRGWQTPPKHFADESSWIARYDAFKRLGTAAHEAGFISRREWRTLLDLVFARSESLQNGTMADKLFHAVADSLVGPARPDFDSIRKIILTAKA